MKKIAVMIVDDSAVVRQVVKQVLVTDPEIEVMAVAPDPIFAYQKMKEHWPDVIVLDIEMPRMDGLTFLRKIMAERPTPVVICSSLTVSGAETTMQALAAGAMTIITKPTAQLKQFLEDSALELIQAVRAASRANVRKLVPGAQAATKIQVDTTATATQASAENLLRTTEKIVAIGTSTGGTQALEAVLSALPKVTPGIVVVQHMPEKFTASFAARLDSLCEIEVREARHNDRVMPGCALIAPGGRHMALKRSGAQYHVEVFDGPQVSRHRPSVDVLFRSVAKHAGRNATGIIMTGMGDDGALGMKEMHDVGAYTVAQDERSCVVFGMPKEAIKLGAVDEVLDLECIPAVIANLGKQMGWKNAM